MLKDLALLKTPFFVRTQSGGEWTEETIQKDAQALASLLMEFAITAMADADQTEIQTKGCVTDDK